ncbi:MAG: ferritin family protein [Candidatus Omnitrophota bacterium]|nr:MAG: ferritin family protein [Candidatus Omnitrophota bacterium]
MNIFNAAEIVDLGIEKEKKRRDFYGLVAEKFENKDLKELFTKLKEWEELHIKKFTEIRGKVKDEEPVESYEGELATYMQVLVDDKLYAEVMPDNFSDNVKSPLRAIQYSIGFEKDAILFFNELLPYTSARNKDLIIELTKEEKKHIVYLHELRSRI